MEDIDVGGDADLFRSRISGPWSHVRDSRTASGRVLTFSTLGRPRDHAIVEQVIADLKNSALAHLPSGQFSANGAWLVCAVMVYNLTRGAGALHAKARTAIRRTRLISVPARIARRLQLHLPADRAFDPGLDDLFRRALHDPVPTATT